MPRLNSTSQKLRFRKGTFDQITPAENAYGEEGEAVYLTDRKSLWVHNGTEYAILNASGALVDTKANILNTTVITAPTAFASDSKEFFVHDGTAWQLAGLKLTEELPNPDMGKQNDNPRQGYKANYLTNKWIYNSILGGNTLAVDGAIRIDHTQTPKLLQFYDNGEWRSLKVFTFTDALNHIGGTTDFQVHNGNSFKKDLNGNPLIQNYEVPMGCYAPRQYQDAGTY